jgi:hypothetical protein
MARIEEKIAEIADPELRQIIAEEVANLKKHTRFGLVFEDHQPEVVPIYGKRIKRGERVAKKAGNLAEIWRVVSIKDGIALCEQEKGGKAVLGTRVPYPTQQLVVIRSMGETIYPSLTPVASVVNGDPTAPHHVLIEADNYHALQLLLFPYEGKVDCIYIDPPYNSGARDWKYNNDYVDGNDAWRHSKWLSMMKRRLLLAKRLLNQDDSVLIVTIDEKEYLRLGLLLEQTFPDARIQMVSSIINPKGSSRRQEFSRSDEYLFFVIDWGGANCSDRKRHDLARANARQWFSQVGRTHARGCEWAPPCAPKPFLSDLRGQRRRSECTLLASPCQLKPQGAQKAQRGQLPFGRFRAMAVKQLGGGTQQDCDGHSRKGYVKIGRFTPGSERCGFTHLQAGQIKELASGGLKRCWIAMQMDRLRSNTAALRERQCRQPHGTRCRTVRASTVAPCFAAFYRTARFRSRKSLYAVEDALALLCSN